MKTWSFIFLTLMTRGPRVARESEPPIKGCGAEPAVLFLFQTYWACRTVAHIRYHYLIDTTISSRWKNFLNNYHIGNRVSLEAEQASFHVLLRQLPITSPHLCSEYQTLTRLLQLIEFGQHATLEYVSPETTSTSITNNSYNFNVLQFTRDTSVSWHHRQGRVICHLPHLDQLFPYIHP